MSHPTEVIQALMITAEVYGKEFSPGAAQLLCSDLSEYSSDQVLKALARCRRECHRFPLLSDIISRIDDGRPGPEEAWAMIPKDEDSSVFWTDEMSEAFGVARKLLENDPVGARMAFKETYQRLLTEARSSRKQVRWTPSLGHDRYGREVAIKEALEKRRISQEHAQDLLEDFSKPRRSVLQLTDQAMKETSKEEASKYIAEIRARIQKSMPGKGDPHEESKESREENQEIDF